MKIDWVDEAEFSF